MRLLTKTEPEMNVTNEKNYQKPNLKSFHWVNREKKSSLNRTTLNQQKIISRKRFSNHFK